MVETDYQKKVVVAAAQISQTDTPKQNLDHMVYVIEQARGVDLVCFPETSLSGLDQVGDHALYHQALQRECRRKKLWIVYGSYDQTPANLYNRGYLIDNTGTRRLTYEKIHLWNEGGVSVGVSTKVADTKLGRIGLAICWDMPHLDVIPGLARRGADWVCIPSYWFGKEFDTEEVIEGLPLSLAFMNQLGIVYCDAYTENGETAARSKICSPRHVLAAAKKREQLITATLNIEEIREGSRIFDCRPKPLISSQELRRLNIRIAPPAHQLLSDCLDTLAFTFGDVAGRSRKAEIVEARHLAAYILSRSGLSITKVGMILGGRDHSTIANSLSRISETRQKDAQLGVLMESIDIKLSKINK